MKSPTRLLRDITAPSALALHERAMKDERTYSELGNGTEIVPIFNPSFRRFEEIGGIELLHDDGGTAYGSRRRYEIETDFGIDYSAVLYRPIGDAKHDFYVDIDTPICTGVRGLNDEVASRLVREIGVPVILKGPEFSATRDVNAKKLASIALAATNVSQSFSAETSMAMSAEIIEREDLPRTAVVYGKSRGAMIGGKKYPYAIDRDINIVHYRLIDPCIGRRAFESATDVLRFGVWPMTDVAKSLPSFAKFALEGRLRERARTIETNAAYIAGMVLGTVPSLLSGESMGDKIPVHKGVSLVHMSNNPIADTIDYLRQFEQHTNFDHHEVRNTHIGGIVLPRNIRRTVRHLTDFSAEFSLVGGDEMKIDWSKVHNNPKKATVTQIHAA